MRRDDLQAGTGFVADDHERRVAVDWQLFTVDRGSEVVRFGGFSFRDQDAVGDLDLEHGLVLHGPSTGPLLVLLTDRQDAENLYHFEVPPSS